VLKGFKINHSRPIKKNVPLETQNSYTFQNIQKLVANRAETGSSEATVETEAEGSSETSVATYQTTQHYISKKVTFIDINAEV
jgi:hypothetical protein